MLAERGDPSPSTSPLARERGSPLLTPKGSTCTLLPFASTSGPSHRGHPTLIPTSQPHSKSPNWDKASKGEPHGQPLVRRVCTPSARLPAQPLVLLRSPAAARRNPSRPRNEANDLLGRDPRLRAGRAININQHNCPGVLPRHAPGWDQALISAQCQCQCCTTERAWRQPPAPPAPKPPVSAVPVPREPCGAGHEDGSLHAPLPPRLPHLRGRWLNPRGFPP